MQNALFIVNIHEKYKNSCDFKVLISLKLHAQHGGHMQKVDTDEISHDIKFYRSKGVYLFRQVIVNTYRQVSNIDALW